MMECTYKNLTIRNAVVDDAALLADWWNDGTIMAHAGFPDGLGTTAEKVAKGLESDTGDTRRRLMLCENGTPIGEMCYENHGIRDGKRTAEIGIKICVAARREHGLGRLYLSMLIGALFAFGYERIVLDTQPENHRAHHVYELLGFRRIGVREKCWRDGCGNWRDAVDYALEKADFHDFTKE